MLPDSLLIIVSQELLHSIVVFSAADSKRRKTKTAMTLMRTSAGTAAETGATGEIETGAEMIDPDPAIAIEIAAAVETEIAGRIGIGAPGEIEGEDAGTGHRDEIEGIGVLTGNDRFFFFGIIKIRHFDSRIFREIPIVIYFIFCQQRRRTQAAKQHDHGAWSCPAHQRERSPHRHHRPPPVP